MHSILPNINRRTEFVTGDDDDEIKHTLQMHQETMKCNFDRENKVQEHTPLLPGTPVMVKRKEGEIWIYSIIIDVSEHNVHEGGCYKIKCFQVESSPETPFMCIKHMFQ